jgi:NADH dehydrogenase
MPTKNIVIVGAGFAGLMTARHLAKHAPKDVCIFLIDQRDRFLFAPRLIDALENPRQDVLEFTVPLAERCKKDGVTFIQARATMINRTMKCVETENGQNLPYDALVLCQGAKTNYYGIPGAEEHSCALKTAGDVTAIGQILESLIEKATQSADDTERRRLLSFVVVGGGASGIESLFAIRNRFTERCRELAPGLTALASFTLIQAGPQILPGFPLKMVNGARQELQKQGVVLLEGQPVSKIEPGRVTTANGNTINAGLVLWAAGISPNKIAIEPVAFMEANGAIQTDRFLHVEPNVFAAGDVISYQERNVIIPKNAQTAMLMAERLADNVLRTLDGRELLPFHYTSKGNLLTLGKTGYVEVKGFAFKTRLTSAIRDLFYRFRQWQITA